MDSQLKTSFPSGGRKLLIPGMALHGPRACKHTYSKHPEKSGGFISKHRVQKVRTLGNPYSNVQSTRFPQVPGRRKKNDALQGNVILCSPVGGQKPLPLSISTCFHHSKIPGTIYLVYTNKCPSPRARYLAVSHSPSNFLDSFSLFQKNQSGASVQAQTFCPVGNPVLFATEALTMARPKSEILAVPCPSKRTFGLLTSR